VGRPVAGVGRPWPTWPRPRTATECANNKQFLVNSIIFWAINSRVLVFQRRELYSTANHVCLTNDERCSQMKYKNNAVYELLMHKLSRGVGAA